MWFYLGFHLAVWPPFLPCKEGMKPEAVLTASSPGIKKQKCEDSDVSCPFRFVGKTESKHIKKSWGLGCWHSFLKSVSRCPCWSFISTHDWGGVTMFLKTNFANIGTVQSSGWIERSTWDLTRVVSLDGLICVRPFFGTGYHSHTLACCDGLLSQSLFVLFFMGARATQA